MDFDLLKSAPDQDQIEMMLMMQMDKIPEFSSAYDNVNEMQMMENSPQGSSSCNNNNNNNIASFMNQPSTISFTNSPQIHQEVSAMNFLSSSSSGRWRNDELGEANTYHSQSDKRNSMAAMREMIFRIAAMQPIHIDPASVKPPKRRNVKISNDPQSVAARHRREKISEKIRILQRLVPGGTKMDTASMLDEAIHYVKFLKNQVQSLERAGVNRPVGVGFPVPMSSGSYLPVMTTKGYHHQSAAAQNVHHYGDG